MKILISLIVIVFTSAIFSHEGHNESSLKPQHGGIIKKSESFFAEVLEEEGGWSLFVTDHNYKILTPSDVNVSAEVEQRKKKSKAVMKFVKDHYEFVAGDSKMNFFKLKVVFKKQEKPNQELVFNLETQK